MRSKLPIGIPIFQPVSEWQHYNKDWSAKNANFATLIGCHWLSVEYKIYQALTALQAWKFGEDPSSSSRALVAHKSTSLYTKNIFKIFFNENIEKKNIGKIYSLLGKRAGRAKNYWYP